MRYFKYSPELQNMMKKAVHFPLRHKYDTSKYVPIIIIEKINGHVVEAIGTMVERNGLDGFIFTSCVRWRVDGCRVNKKQLLTQFGIEV